MNNSIDDDTNIYQWQTSALSRFQEQQNLNKQHENVIPNTLLGAN